MGVIRSFYRCGSGFRVCRGSCGLLHRGAFFIGLFLFRSLTVGFVVRFLAAFVRLVVFPGILAGIGGGRGFVVCERFRLF